MKQCNLYKIKKLRENRNYTDNLNWEKLDINDLVDAFLSFIEWYNDFDIEEFDRRVEFNYSKLTHIADEENRHNYALIDTIKNIIRYYFLREDEFIDAIESWSRSNSSRPHYTMLLKALISPLIDKKESDEEEKEYQKRVALGSSDKYDSRWNESISKHNKLRNTVKNIRAQEGECLDEFLKRFN